MPDFSQALRGCCGEPTELEGLEKNRFICLVIPPNDSMVALDAKVSLVISRFGEGDGLATVFWFHSVGKIPFTRLWLGNLFEPFWLLVIHEGDR